MNLNFFSHLFGKGVDTPQNVKLPDPSKKNDGQKDVTKDQKKTDDVVKNKLTTNAVGKTTTQTPVSSKNIPTSQEKKTELEMLNELPTRAERRKMIYLRKLDNHFNLEKKILKEGQDSASEEERINKLLSPGSVYILKELSKSQDVGQFELDIVRKSHTFIIGDKNFEEGYLIDKTSKEVKDPNVLYNEFCDDIKDHIYTETKVVPDPSLVDVILNSAISQTLPNQVLIDAGLANLCPVGQPWAQMNTVKEIKIQIEDKILKNIIMTARVKKDNYNTDTDVTCPLTAEAKISFNVFRPNEMKIEYKYSFNGNEISWDPSKETMAEAAKKANYNPTKGVKGLTDEEYAQGKFIPK